MGYLMLVLTLLGLGTTSYALTVSKCKGDDQACIKQSAQALLPILAVGLPDLGVKSLDPLSIAKIDGSSNNLKLIASDVTVKGLKDCLVSAISRETSTGKMNIDLLCNVDAQGHYEIFGEILVLPINGSGHLAIKLNKALISVKTDLAEIEQNGKKHWQITDWDFTWDLKERANIELTNLFGGSEALTSAIREIVGQNANEIVKEVGPPIVKKIAGEVIEGVNQFFNSVPTEELTL